MSSVMANVLSWLSDGTEIRISSFDTESGRRQIKVSKDLGGEWGEEMCLLIIGLNVDVEGVREVLIGDAFSAPQIHFVRP